jgi:hypothetical protein
MCICKRILAGLTFLMSLAVLLLALAGGVGVWLVKGPATAKLTWALERIDAALSIVEEGLDHVKQRLAAAAERLNRTREEQRSLAEDPGRNDVLRRMLASGMQRMMAPEMDAHAKLHKVAEAAIVANTVLEDLGPLSALPIPGLNLGDLEEISNKLNAVESTAWEMSRLFSEREVDSTAAGARLSAIQQILQTVQGLIAKYEPLVVQVRERTEQLKSMTLPWITPAAILISVVCFWIALAQVSLMFHACGWWKCAGKSNSPAAPT